MGLSVFLPNLWASWAALAENETRVKIMFIVRRPPSHCVTYNVPCSPEERQGHINTGSRQSCAFPWLGLVWFLFFSVFWAFGSEFWVFSNCELWARELPNCCNLPRYYIYCLPDNYDDYLRNGVFKTFSAGLGTEAEKSRRPHPRRAFATQLWAGHHHHHRLLAAHPPRSWVFGLLYSAAAAASLCTWPFAQFLADNLHYFVRTGGGCRYNHHWPRRQQQQ